MAFPMILSAVRSMQNAAKSEAAISRDEMPIKLLYVAIVGAAILLAVMAVLSIIPVVGSGLVWVPAGCDLCVIGQTTTALILGIKGIIQLTGQNAAVCSIPPIFRRYHQRQAMQLA